jgi:hypothetical protein
MESNTSAILLVNILKYSLTLKVLPRLKEEQVPLKYMYLVGLGINEENWTWKPASFL